MFHSLEVQITQPQHEKRYTNTQNALQQQIDFNLSVKLREQISTSTQILQRASHRNISLLNRLKRYRSPRVQT
jgi:hypothetical protein